MQQYTVADLAVHNSEASCWYGLYGVVFNLTNYLSKHPGGLFVIRAQCGKDATAMFKLEKKHDAALLAKKGFSTSVIGRLGSTRGTIEVPCNEVGLVAVTA